MNNQDVLDAIESILLLIAAIGAKISWGQGKRTSDSEERRRIIALLESIEQKIAEGRKSHDGEQGHS